MNTIFTAFKEHKDFSYANPFSVIPTTFDCDDTVAPHYADSVELLLFDGAKGEVRIGGHTFLLSGKQVFFIAPEVVHAMHYEKSNGTLLNVKFSPEGLNHFLDLSTVLSTKAQSLATLSVNPPCYDELFPFVRSLSDCHDIFSALTAVIGIFGELCRHTDAFSAPENAPGLKNSELCDIINYTNEHFAKPIRIEDIALRMGYSKYYFCTKFRQSTGITYLSYLNGVRISRACACLSKGLSVGETAELCGFSDVPYFIQLFKKIKGITPKRYAGEVRV